MERVKGRKLLDGKECFLLWYEKGSIKKALEYMIMNGKINPKTRRPYRRYSIWMAAMNWIVNNNKEAYQYYKNSGADFTQEQWEKWLVKKALHIFHNRKNSFFKWIDENGFRKYEYIYIDKMGKDIF